MPATLSANRVPTLSSSAGEKEIEFEPEDHQTRSSDKVQLSGTKRLVGAKKIYKQGSTFERLFGEKMRLNPLEDRRSLYESRKGSLALMRKYTTTEMTGEQASASNPHQQKCFLLSKAIWGAEGIAFQSANGKSKESKKRVTKKRDLVSSRNRKNAQDGCKRGNMEKSPHVQNGPRCNLRLKKEPQEKMKKLHANELECQKIEDTLKGMNEVTSLIMAAD
ncbi:hypothetical protein Bca4012_060946 [Brassica carinata]|uniref:Uncharacterized protein n=1 Tax=Brassica carinata TaxID=52824 RepID=A0A8X7V411_BRACI|nr:hypothetical protein Bca52824_031261 [Brassica carinata]